MIGRFSVDFVSTRGEEDWRHFALDLNLRKGGTTLPFLMLQYLTDGLYNDGGLYRTPTGQARFYHASDNVESLAYRDLDPDVLINLAVLEGLHFDATKQQGVVFHLMGALAEWGKLGVVCIGDSPARAEILFQRTIDTLDAATR